MFTFNRDFPGNFGILPWPFYQCPPALYLEALLTELRRTGRDSGFGKMRETRFWFIYFLFPSTFHPGPIDFASPTTSTLPSWTSMFVFPPFCRPLVSSLFTRTIEFLFCENVLETSAAASEKSQTSIFLIDLCGACFWHLIASYMSHFQPSYNLMWHLPTRGWEC